MGQNKHKQKKDGKDKKEMKGSVVTIPEDKEIYRESSSRGNIVDKTLTDKYTDIGVDTYDKREEK